MKLAPEWWRRLLRLDDDQLFEELRFMPDERFKEAIEALSLDRALSLARMDPGDDAEARQRAWAGYLESVPMLICVACGGMTGTAGDPEGEPVEVEPSWLARLLAFEVLSEFGMGDFEEKVQGFTGAKANDVLAGFGTMLEDEFKSHLGISLRQARYRWRSALRWGQIRRAVRLGLEPPTLTEMVLAARECGRIAVGRRALAGA